MSEPSLTIKSASRAGVKALVGFYGKSGSGKTMSALLFARGIVGPKGRIAFIDTESGRGSIFADLIPGGYQVIELDAPFSPERYTEAIELAEKSADITVVDSMSHEWSGEGGVLDMQERELDRMAGNDYGKREACKMAAWIKPKAAHKKMVQRLLRSKNPLICCLRGEEKTHIVKGENGGKNKVITDEFSTPLFDPRFIFEMLLNFETLNINGEGGFVYPVKITHPSIKALLPGPKEQIGVKHGAALAQWCIGAASPTTSPASTEPVKPAAGTTASAPTDSPIDEMKVAKADLWNATKSVRGPAKDWKGANQWLIDEAFLDPTEKVEDLTVEQLRKLTVKVKTKLGILV